MVNAVKLPPFCMVVVQVVRRASALLAESERLVAERGAALDEAMKAAASYASVAEVGPGPCWRLTAALLEAHMLRALLEPAWLEKGVFFKPGCLLQHVGVRPASRAVPPPSHKLIG